MKNNHFKQIRNLVGKPAGILAISGIIDVEIAPVISALSEESTIKQGLVVVPDFKAAVEMAENIKNFQGGCVEIWPEEEGIFLFDSKDSKSVAKRMEILKRLCHDEEFILVATGASLIKKLPVKEALRKEEILLSIGGEHNIEDLLRAIINMGYERTTVCEATGQVSLRGGILDIYPIGESHPARIEFFDTEIDSIRKYDVDTQRSIGACEAVSIFPRTIISFDDEEMAITVDAIKKEYERAIAVAEGEERENLNSRLSYLTEHITQRTSFVTLENYSHYFNNKVNFLFDYFKEDAIFYLNDFDRIYEACDEFLRESGEEMNTLVERGLLVSADMESAGKITDLLNIKKQKKICMFQPLPKVIKHFEKPDALMQIRARRLGDYSRNTELLAEDIRIFGKNGYDITFVCLDDERAAGIKEFLISKNIAVSFSIKIGSIDTGIEYPDEKLVYITDESVLGSKKSRNRKNKIKRSKENIKNFTDIQKGDYVVHEVHGIGKFVGIDTMTVLGASKDYLKVKYAGEDNLYIPVEQMNLIQKYIGSGGKPPKISKLSGAEWRKTKEKAKIAVMDMAKELLELNAERAASQGYKFSEDSVWQNEFEDMFPYEETEDQLKAIEEIKKDMEKPVPMDRLLCGDVGYGKTEVAARGIFKCLAEGKQAAILVPTTLLANQHYYTMKDRFEHFPFKVDMLSRFRTETQQKEIVGKLSNGTLDMIIGTHRLLSEDVKFKDLGLLVVDEEQRFGVKHKEKIKMLKNNVDVLTLSATPIPRTLNMSLVGLKSMSLITQPPEERFPVETYVMEMHPGIMKNAIEKELARGGQVFIVFNRVKGIQKIARDIRDLVPDAEIAVGHGQMEEKQLEDVMMSFVNGEKDILISTTIIETGIDISNANTMIILDADKFGLSQLYQLRGRVGRSTRKAFTYLFYTQDKVLTETAVKRLKAIRDFTEFGAGFKVAMRDLEIRGAGNLLGTRQSGHMVDVGYEMYCKLLAEAVGELKGEEQIQSLRDVTLEIPVSAYIPKEYIRDEYARLDAYKKIAEIQTKDDIYDITDELIDRFGEVPKETENLMKIAFIKTNAMKIEIETIKTQGNKIEFNFYQGSMVNREAIAKIIDRYRMKATVYGSMKPAIKISKIKDDMLTEIMDFLSLFS